MKRMMRWVALFLVGAVAVFLPGCSLSDHGKMRLQPAGPGRVTPDDLVRTWKNYEVYYSGFQTYRPSAVLFDPKGDSKNMTVHPWWVKVTDESLLLEVMNWMSYNLEFDPVVWRILGPDNAFHGYLYTAWNHALIRVVDENTLWIDEMSIPPDYPGGQDSVMVPGR